MKLILEGYYDRLKKKPSDTFIFTTKGDISFLEFLKLSERLDLKVKDRSFVPLVLDNNPHALLAIFNVWTNQSAVVPLSVRLNPVEISKILKYNKFDQIYVWEEKFKEHLPLKNEHEIRRLKKIDFYLKEEDFMSDSKEGLPSSSKENICLIMHTSGSEGFYKGVVHSFESLLNSVWMSNSIIKHSSEDKWLLSLPIYHIGGFMIFFRSLVFGTKIIVPDSLSTDDLIYSIDKFKPTLISLTPTQLKRILDKKYIIPDSVRAIFIGGGPSDARLIKEALDQNLPICKVYGSTETGSMVVAATREILKDYPDAAGLPLPGAFIKIKEFENSNEGEILVKSPSLFINYYNMPKETKLSFEKGFYKTGDIGKTSNDGILYVLSRRSDLIISGGENVSTYEVEAAIKSHPLVTDAFVFGYQDYEWGQIVCAAVQLKIKDSVSDEQLKVFLKEKVASFKIPKRIYFVDAIPRNEIGKVNRKYLLDHLGLSE